MEFGNPEMLLKSNSELKPIHPEKLEALANAEIILASIKNKEILTDDFTDEAKGGYTENDIENDKERVRLRKEDFEKEQDHLSAEDRMKINIGKKRGKALEAIAINMAGKRNQEGELWYNWYGRKAYVMETTEFDDICRGVDGVLEFDMGQGQSHKIALAIDASMRVDMESVKRKMKRGAENIANGKMEVKYFKSAVSGYKGKLKSVIPVVLGLEGDNANKLIRLFAQIVALENKQGRSLEEDEDLAYKIHEAQKHPCQVVFLKEMKVQLEMYQKMFNRQGSFIKNDLIELLKIVTALLDDKKNIHAGFLESDGIHEMICEVAKQLPLERDEIIRGKK